MILRAMAERQREGGRQSVFLAQATSSQAPSPERERGSRKPARERRSAIDLHGTSAALHAASASHRASPTDTRFAASTSAGGEPRQLPDCAIDIGTGDFLEDKMPFPTSPTPAPTPTPIYDSPPPPSQTKGQGQGRSTDLLNLMFDGPGGDRRLNAPAKQQARQGEGRGAAETVTLDTDAASAGTPSPNGGDAPSIQPGQLPRRRHREDPGRE